MLLAGTLVLSSGCGDALSHSAPPRRDGVKLLNEGRYAEAAGAFNAAVKSNPRDHYSFFYLGECYEQLGDPHRAIQAYQTSLAVMPYSIHDRGDRAFREKLTDRLANAIASSPTPETQIAAIERRAQAENSARDYYLLARIHISAGDADSAIDAYNRAMLADPRDQQIARSYGLWLESIGQTKPAERPLRIAYSLNDKDQDVIAALGRLGIIVGPSLKDENQLASPAIPKGPIPELQMPGRSTPPANQPSAVAPRD